MDRPLVERWFAKLADDFANPVNGSIWPFVGGNLGACLVEVLSDSSNELFCAGMLAAHLRGFGRKKLGKHFWVRCEWSKFDISYGLATRRFRDWNEAWAKEETGDIGCIELKVIYSHFAPSVTRVRLTELAAQLGDRRRRVAGWDRARDHPGATLYRYDGLVLHVGSEEPTHDLARLLSDSGLKLHKGSDDWVVLGKLDESKLGTIWPRESLKSWTLRAALVK